MIKMWPLDTASQAWQLGKIQVKNNQNGIKVHRRSISPEHLYTFFFLEYL